MFKRANKITALVVAAASIMSVVPAMAATKLGTKDGTIESAVAYKNGYLYEGYRTDDDTKGLYYNSGDKDKKLDDADSIDTAHGKYDSKYVAALDGSDQYVVDLSNGKVTDEDTVDDLQDTAATKLQNKLKKTDRYGSGVSITSSSLTKVDENKFSDVWYSYEATTAGGAIASGYTNQSGTYIDAGYNANIYVYDGHKMVKIKNVGDEEENTYSGTTVTVKLNSITPVATIGQDDKYIYRIVDANITGAVNLKKASGDTDSQNLRFVQKLAKAQGEDEKDAYLPKSTESFQISDSTAATGNLANGDVKDAYSVLDRLVAGHDSTAKAAIVDGAIYVTYTNDDKVKTEKVVLKTSEKLDTWNTDGTKSSTKVDGHVAKKDGDEDTKADDWTIDVNGSVWAIKDGEISKSEKMGDFKTMYTCDRSLDKLDVYDDNNLIAWENDGDAYTTVAEGKKQAEDDASTIVQPTPAKVGWDKLADGTWNFYDATGAKVANNWVNVGGAWYFLKADGVMATGWQQVGGTWYYLAGSGAMATGWINDGGNWYYLNASGAMLANTTTPDGYYVGPSGAWVK
ncbi:N-acetylmuramoyl-L-alanine amidase family protein [Clostridium beijerinckii]|uniref:N-acetylmuramoyl-L-alanine amidase family protein n=1 Tax=Clostridium beijerinckii TaxID=1520 RepID=A0A7X9XNH9_CLOBE|nr:N-acetylmuramoyl-L-alanine amidase family protein [Clostridium beijerinckii]NMF04263.1 N-acetylmuramoyl-L-alanine amidase family protein [Clostridium beijerinckii]